MVCNYNNCFNFQSINRNYQRDIFIIPIDSLFYILLLIVNTATFQNGIFRFCGLDVLAPHIIYGMDTDLPEKRTAKLNLWEQRLECIFEEAPLYFIPSGNELIQDYVSLSAYW